MADAQRTIDLIFNGVDRTAAAVQSALKNTGQFASGVQTATQPIADFTASAVKLEAGLLAAGAAVAAFSIKVASDFQGAALDLQKVLGDTDPALEVFTQRARELSLEYGVASTEVLQSMADFKQAGFTAEEAATLTKNALDLVIAGGVEAGMGSDLLVASIKGFGAEAKDAATIIDLLNGVSNEYATNLGELLIGFSQVSPIAKVAGLSLEETVGILTPGIEVFRSGSEVSNALRTSLLRLVDDSKPVQEGLAALGVAQKDTNGELRSARDIYFDVAGAFQNLDDNQKVYIASQLVGINQSAKFIAMTEGLDKTLRITGDGFDYLGSAAEEVAVRMQSAEVQVDRTIASFNDMALSIGAPLLDEFTGIAEAFAGIFQAIGASAADSSGLGQIVEYVETLMGDLEDTVRRVAQNLPAALEGADFSRFRQAIDVVVGSLKNLFGDIDLSTVDGLSRAIETVGAAFLGLSQFTAGVIDSFKPLFDLLVRAGSGFTELDSSVFRTAGQLSGFITQANQLAGGINGLLPVLEGLLAVLLVKQAGGLVGGFTKVSGALSGAGGLIKLLGSGGLLTAAGAAGYALGTELAGGLDKVVQKTTDSESLGDWIYQLVNGRKEAEMMARALESTTPPFQGFGTAAAQAARDLERTAEVSKSVRDTFWESTGVLEDYGDGLDSLAGTGFRFASSAEEAERAAEGLDAAGKQTAASLKEVGKSAEEVRVLSEEAFVKLEEIASNERIKNIEARVSLDIAEVEANTQRALAAFESINTTITSTGDILSGLFDNLGDAGSIRERFQIERQLEIENERRQDALDLQKELTQAQIRSLNARTEALRRGDAMIRVDGAGLQPHLEAFMFEILEAIQVRVNAEGQEFLLGVPS